MFVLKSINNFVKGIVVKTVFSGVLPFFLRKIGVTHYTLHITHLEKMVFERSIL